MRATALCRSLLMGVFYGFIFVIILYDNKLPLKPKIKEYYLKIYLSK